MIEVTLRDKISGKIYHNAQVIRSGYGQADWIIFVADERPLTTKNWNKDPFFAQQFEEIDDEK